SSKGHAHSMPFLAASVERVENTHDKVSSRRPAKCRTRRPRARGRVAAAAAASPVPESFSRIFKRLSDTAGRRPFPAGRRSAYPRQELPRAARSAASCSVVGWVERSETQPTPLRGGGGVGHELQGDAVDAVAQPRRRRPVLEHVAEVSA